MSWDERHAIASRLATRLGDPASVVLVDEAGFGELAAAALQAAQAIVVAGSPAGATSAGLAALRASVGARGLDTPLATFATVPGGAEVPLVIGAPAGDARIAGLLAAGPHSLLLDPVADVAADAAPARVCVVSFELSGLTGGGIGTASTSLAESLARAGHDVTLLFTGWQDAGDGERNEHWRHHCGQRGVRLAFVREPGAAATVKSPYFPVRSAYEVYCWLEAQETFDVVHLPENMGHGAFAQLAKRQGSAFADTTFAIGTHGPTRWAAEANRVALTREEFLVNDALERISVAHADVLLGPSRYLHDYMRARGWQLPARVHVQPYAIPGAVRDGSQPRPAGQLPDEIAFFGRLETRKGVATLCDALDLLAADADPPAFSVTFLGPVAHVLGQPADVYIAARAERWPWRWQILADRDQQGAAEHLARPGVLAVMPSLVDNAPNTVSEAVALGIPLVAARTGGTGELVAAEQRDDHMFGEPAGGPLLPMALGAQTPAADPRPLAELLRRRLTAMVEPARPAADADAVEAAYDAWHRGVRSAREARRPSSVHSDTAPPSLSVCVLYDGDEQLLAAQLDALTGADEVVVADLRAQPTREIAARAVRPDTPGHAAQARTAAVAATSGELVAIVSPGDVPLAGFAAALRGAAAATQADVYSCTVLDAIEPHEPQDPSEAALRAFVPVPGPALAGLTHPAFAAGPYAIRRASLERLGGFAADARGDEADHELLNRAAAAGLQLEVVPQPLAAKRRADRWSTFRAVWPHETAEPQYDAEQWLRVERPYAADAGEAERLVGLLRGARTDAVRFEAELRRQHGVYEGRFAEQRIWIDNLEEEAARLREELASERSRSTASRAARTARNAAKRLSRGR